MALSSNDIALPRGISDFLPEAAAKIGTIESRLLRVFELWGFRRVITPRLEYEDVLSAGMGDELKGKTYRFDDRQSGRLLALPPDITPQIARIAATRMAAIPLPHRLSYSERVLRQTEMQTGRSRELFQTGVELIGLDDEGGPGLPEIALHGDGDQIAAPHAVHPSTSAKASSMKSSISVSAMSATAAARMTRPGGPSVWCSRRVPASGTCCI